MFLRRRRSSRVRDRAFTRGGRGRFPSLSCGHVDGVEASCISSQRLVGPLDHPEDTVPEFLWRLVGLAVGGAMGILRRLGGALLGVARRYAPSLLLRILRAGVRAAVALYLRVANGLASGLLGMVRLVIRLG